MTRWSCLTAAFWVLAPASALAYVGPGAGITLLGTLWAVIAALGLLLVALVSWPARAFLRRRKALRRAGKEGKGA